MLKTTCDQNNNAHTAANSDVDPGESISTQEGLKAPNSAALSNDDEKGEILRFTTIYGYLSASM